VVTRDLPDFCVAAGVPARVIREYTTETGWRSARDAMGSGSGGS
jgi:acetyltransferase-like isoleucine patch superfamily enzyme